jgi:hypothetical protein
MICPNCKNESGEGSVFCPVCGTRLDAAPAQASVSGEADGGQAQADASGEAGREDAAADAPPVRQRGMYSPANMTPFSQKVDEAPLSTGDFVLMHLISKIGIVRLVMGCVWAFSRDTNLNRRNWARAALIWILIDIGLAILLVMFIIAVSSASIFASPDLFSDWADSFFSTLSSIA